MLGAPRFSISPRFEPAVQPMTARACCGIVDPEDGRSRPKVDADHGRDRAGQRVADREPGIRKEHAVSSQAQTGKRGTGGEGPVKLWCDLLVSSLLWAAMIAGLIRVVRDCLKDWHLKPTFADSEDESCQCSSCPGNLEILFHQHKEPMRREEDDVRRTNRCDDRRDPGGTIDPGGCSSRDLAGQDGKAPHLEAALGGSPS